MNTNLAESHDSDKLSVHESDKKVFDLLPDVLRQYERYRDLTNIVYLSADDSSTTLEIRDTPLSLVIWPRS